MNRSFGEWKSSAFYRLDKICEFAVFEGFVELANELGYSKVAFGLEFPNSVIRPDYCYFSNFHEDWRSRFAHEGATQMGAKSAVGKRTVSVSDAGLSSPHWTRDDFNREALLNEIRFNWVQSVAGFAGTTSLVGLAGGDPIPGPRVAERLSVLADIVSMKMIMHLVPKFLPQSAESVTDLERECLQWVLDGKTVTEIADILSAKESAIRHLQLKLRNRFDKGSILATAVLAYRMGKLRDDSNYLSADALGASPILFGGAPEVNEP